MQSRIRQMISIFVAFIAFAYMSATTSSAETINNVYDDLNRLIRTEYGDGTALIYDYDEVGNRIQKTVCTNLPVRVTPTYYLTLQAAYNAATNGATIQAMNTIFYENVNFNRNISIILTGGYVCDYSSNPDYTTINGTMTITSGTVTVNKIILQ